MFHRLLKLLLAASLERQPMVLHQLPHYLDVVKASGRRKLACYTLLLQLFERRLDRSVVQHDDQRHALANLLRQFKYKDQEDFGGTAELGGQRNHSRLQLITQFLELFPAARECGAVSFFSNCGAFTPTQGLFGANTAMSGLRCQC